LRLLDGIRQTGINTKFYQASSSELFGKVQETPQRETTPFYPRSPYGVAKLFAYWITVNYRESYDIFAVNGILFNHESPRRGENFVTRKITRGLSRIKHGLESKLYLGNLDAQRDWGYAEDYVEAMWLMLQHSTPEDFVIATGETHTVREFIEKAAGHLGMNIEWRGSGDKEKGIDTVTNKTIIEIDPAYYRPTEVDLLIGDGSKAKELLKWQPKVGFEELVKLMVEADLATTAPAKAPPKKHDNEQRS
jgi:GDPmannose 4,6-dehydratase